MRNLLIKQRLNCRNLVTSWSRYITTFLGHSDGATLTAVETARIYLCLWVTSPVTGHVPTQMLMATLAGLVSLDNFIRRLEVRDKYIIGCKMQHIEPRCRMSVYLQLRGRPQWAATGFQYTHHINRYIYIIYIYEKSIQIASSAASNRRRYTDHL